jgi:hypothetical protein
LTKLNTTTRNAKIAACLSLARHYIKNNVDLINKLISYSDLDKSGAYDKIVSSMMIHCTNHISEEDYKKTLLPENISNPSAIKFEFVIAHTGLLTDKEKNMLKEISQHSFSSETDNLKDDIKELKLKKQIIQYFKDGYAIIIGVALIICFIVFILGFKGKRDKEIKSKKKNN